MKRRIYLDYAASTPVDKRVFRAMEPYLTDCFGNPSSIHWHGRKMRGAVDEARASIANILNCKDTEVYFTSGGTEGDNLAIFGIVKLSQRTTNNLQPTTKPHIVTTTIEHHAVLKCCEELEKEGVEVTYVTVGKSGVVKVEDIKQAIKDNTVLVSVMYVNNEIGTIQPIRQIGELVESQNLKRKSQNHNEKLKINSLTTNYQLPATNKFVPQIYFHTDACQAAGYLELDVEKLGVDLLTFNGAKIYGPQGVGALYVKKGIVIRPIVYGGDQEWGLRAGTENVAGVVGIAKAFEIAQGEKANEWKRLSKLRDRMLRNLIKIPNITIDGDMEKRLPGNINISIFGAEGEALTLFLDEAGINVSTGSACTSASLEPSHVLLAIGIPKEVAHGSLRISLGRYTTNEDVDYVIKILPKIVERLRKISAVKINNRNQ